MMKATAVAPSNIAFVKYWGKSNDALTLPNNGSISMNLAKLWTKTRVEFFPSFKKDEVWIAFFGEKSQLMQGTKADRVIAQVERLRKLAGVTFKAKIVSENNFPAGVGIASSASAFAALTLACVKALGISVTQKKLSILTRLGGSGSAIRSIPDGIVEWIQGSSSDTSYAKTLADETYWDLADVVLVVSTEEKKASSLEGHEAVNTSPFYKARLQTLPQRLKIVRSAIRQKNLQLLGEELEKEALSLHSVAMSCDPPIFYLNGGTFFAIQDIYELRSKNIPVYFTMDAGPNVHAICLQKDMQKIRAYFEKKPYIQHIFTSEIGKGARVIEEKR